MVPTSHALAPLRRQSVLFTLKSPHLLLIEILAGLVTSLALIPEALAFAVVAGVDPKTGLFTSVILAMVIAITGGRPAMISGAAGSTALVIAPLVASHGTDYLVATVLLAGLLQIIFAALGVAKLMRFIPRQVMVGFVNALAILIFSSQLPQLIGVPWLVYPMVSVGVLLVFGLPRLSKAVPAPLVVIVLLTLFAVLTGAQVPTVGDYGELPSSLPTLFFPALPLTLETLRVILPYALGMAFVGLVESLMTAKLVDDITDTHSNKTRESAGLGIANLAAGFFGGMGGCAMIGQTMINVNGARARTRISTFFAGFFILLLSLLLGDIVAMIPMAALVAIMIFVALTTFDWHSVSPSTLKTMPKAETAVMLATVLITVATHNLALGVGTGILLAMALFARRVARFVTVARTVSLSEDGASSDSPAVATYRVSGQLFFASSNDLYTLFDYQEDPEQVIIDMSDSHVWDASTVSALDSVVTKYHRLGKTARVIGLDEVSGELHGRLTGRL
ncbi:SulP family inorganic anion transporter [Rothia aerolata]|uniref:Sodium-independent anion transporter n=1 Tax=Rothia aerolata TaxID=1812262 RepID=A0A917MWQ5_9MICC|nr:SulP family inorganic anion transporter [Rothia aerolata]GGH65297.1 sodium-independent anion transporter [Rothia aerolata]